jgi:hypothetical protein
MPVFQEQSAQNKWQLKKNNWSFIASQKYMLAGSCEL